MDNLDTLGMWKKKQKKQNRKYMCICQEVSDTSLALIILKFLVWVTFCKSVFLSRLIYNIG